MLAAISNEEIERMTLGPDDLSRLYTGHSEALFNYLARRVGREIAEDLVAETFRAAIESSESFDERRGDGRSWLFGIATNLARRHWRTEAQRLRALGRRDLDGFGGGDSVLSLADGVATRLDAAMDASFVAAAVSELAAEDREILILAAWERMNSTEIGSVLDMTPGAVRMRLGRIRQQLRTFINSQPSTRTLPGETNQ